MSWAKCWALTLKGLQADREFVRKTNVLVQWHIEGYLHKYSIRKSIEDGNAAAVLQPDPK